ncbi:U11/U12 small nuclear ribonucleoprotein 48 kDa protein-like [Acanthopagrus latus]|uniref:U11/U12 small nuclear ribonucleoprotein 48 kDa protein-like n=1 Tax=Acanthopagrus latus TaxID=8177 RepID=UPI00187C34EE|nr:U11/U12 small nuclear ribonucleoprotein 48 kDa protein-like [Acanthopagrus latus]
MSDSLEIKTLQDRLDRIQELEEFTENCKIQLDKIYKTLGWSRDYNREPMELCPYDPNHRVPVRSMEKHKASCSLRKMGYSSDEQAEMVDPSVCYEKSSVRSFTMDKSTQHQVILKARSAAPLMKMEGVFWQVTVVSTRASLSMCLRTTSVPRVTSPWPTGWLSTITWPVSSAKRSKPLPPAMMIFM